MIYGLLFVTLQDISLRKMKLVTILLLTTLLLSACGNSAARSARRAPKGAATVAAVQPEPKQYTYRVKASYPHSTKAYTQGLLWHDGQLWEGTGQHGESVVQTLDLETGRSHEMARLPRCIAAECRIMDECTLLQTVQRESGHDEKLQIHGRQQRRGLRVVRVH